MGEIIVSLPAAQDIEDEKFENDFSIFFTTEEPLDKVLAAAKAVSEIEDACADAVSEEMLEEPAHMGGWQMWDEVLDRLCGRKVFFDTAYTLNQSIYKGWDEVAGSILASVATTMVVFIPIALLKGLIGDILSPVAVTIVMAIGSSFLVAVIIVPYLLKLLLREEGPKLRDSQCRVSLYHITYSCVCPQIQRCKQFLFQFCYVHFLVSPFFVLLYQSLNSLNASLYSS